MSLQDFRKAAKQRDLDPFGLLDPAPFETLDREEFLPPVAYSLHGFWHHDQPGNLEAGDLIVREESGHIPWEDLRAVAKDRHDARLYVLYHHWQLITLAELVRALTPPVPFGNLGDGLERFYEARTQMVDIPEVPRHELRAAAQRSRDLELLLVRVQNAFMPLERGAPHASNYKGGAVVGLTEDAALWAIEQRRDLDYALAADECGMTAGDLAELYRRLAIRAEWVDPNEALFLLLDQIKRGRRERLKGMALRALDLYDAARLVRQWHARLGDDVLEDVDDITALSPEWKERVYGTRDIRGNRAVLPLILEEHGLYPWRVQLVGEGDSELAALEEILNAWGFSFEELGIAVTDMGGADIPAKAERLIGSLRLYANYFLLVFDNEGNARKFVEILVRSGVIEGVSDRQRREALRDALEAVKQQSFADPAAQREALHEARGRAKELEFEPGQAPEFLLWRDNLESDNFTIAEICEAVRGEAARQGLDTLDVNVDAVQQRMAEHPERGIATIVVELCEAADPPLRITKPDLARVLARYAIEHPELDGKTRPILDLADHLVHLTWADRRLAGELR